MAGERELLTYIPPVLLTASIPDAIGATTTTALAEARIAGSADPTYGTIGWTPRLDDRPFAVIYGGGPARETQVETGRVRTAATVRIFIAIAVANVPGLGVSMNDRAVAWRDAMRALIPLNRRLSPAADNFWPTAGDVRWEMALGNTGVKEREDILGIAYYGVEIVTLLSWTTLVTFQN